VARIQKFAGVAGAVLVLALLCSTASLAARSTTAPGQHVFVYFVINDRSIRYEILRQTAGGGNDFLFLEKWVVRGDQATFVVINRGKKPHNFVFYGHKIPPLKPGKRARFSAALLRRGSFPYATAGKAKGFRGVFPVR
jgi:hypothetical protein